MTQAKRIGKGLWWDRAWTLVQGCAPVSTGCEHCWAMAMERRFRGGDKSVCICEDRLTLPATARKPATWAVWNDLFHEDVVGWNDPAGFHSQRGFDFLVDAFHVMRQAARHTFIILTKRPHVMMDIVPRVRGKLGWTTAGGWPNVVLGVTAENQEAADKRIPFLLRTPAARRIVSVEPMLGPVDISAYLPRWKTAFYNRGGRGQSRSVLIKPGVGCIICGCESGSGRRETKIEWIRSLRDQCVEAGVAFFLKQMDVGGRVVKLPELDGRVWDELAWVTASECNHGDTECTERRDERTVSDG